MLLCNPNRAKRAYISHHSALVYKPRLHGASEISFTIHSHYDEAGQLTPCPYYALLRKNRLIALCTDFSEPDAKREWYVIEEERETSTNGRVHTKTILAYSYEKTLSRKNADFADGTYRFYDPVSPAGTLLHTLVGAMPGWSIGHVDSALYSRWRTFENVNDTLYGFMLGDCEEAYDCLFQFDTDARTVNAYEAAGFVQRTNILLTYQNLIQHIEIDSEDSDICTALSVVGGGEVDIRSVNPTGDNYLYDYSHYKSTEWITPGLIGALDAWEKKVAANRAGYAAHLTTLRTQLDELLRLEGELGTLRNELNALEETRTAQYPNVLKATSDAIDTKLAAIAAKQREITTKESQIATVEKQMDAIVELCRIRNNFSPALLAELDEITYQGEYTNANFIHTGSMTYAEKQEVCEQLLERGRAELADVSRQHYSFELGVLNFLFVERFAKYAGQLELGRSVNVEMQEGVWSFPLLMELHIEYDNPASFRMLFGTRLRMHRDETSITEALYEANSVSKKVSASTSVWDLPVKSGLADEVTAYMKNTLEAANHNIVNSEKQSVSFGLFGIRSQKQNADGGFDPRQLWINNGLICLTDNNWQSTKLAIGDINGVYAVNAEVLAGKLIAGNTLHITNDVGSVSITDKVKFTDMDLLLQSGSNSFALSPAAGLQFKAGSKALVDMDLKNGKLSMQDMSLALTSGTGSFVLDPASGLKFSHGGKAIVDMNLGSGKFTVNDMALTLTNSGNTITLDAANGLRLRRGSTNVVNLSIANGNAEFEGKITAASGNIGGWTIDSDRLRNSSGDFIHANGTGKLSLLSWTKESASFNGNIYAKNLDAYGITNDKLANESISTENLRNASVTGAKLDTVYCTALRANSIEAGYIAADRIVAESVNAAYAYINSIKTDYIDAIKGDFDKLISGQLVANTFSTRKAYILSLVWGLNGQGMVREVQPITIRTGDGQYVTCMGWNGPA